MYVCKINRKFLDLVRESGDCATTLVNLLEVAGILSFNLNQRQLHELIVHLPSHYHLRISPPFRPTEPFPCIPMDELMEILSRKCSLGDALVLHQVERHATSDGCFVSWDAKHFAEMELPVMTPTEFLDSRMT